MAEAGARAPDNESRAGWGKDNHRDALLSLISSGLHLCVLFAAECRKMDP